jgi:hypothetical protein
MAVIDGLISKITNYFRLTQKKKITANILKMQII